MNPFRPCGNAYRLCQGTLLSREQYLVDLERFGYHDARVEPHGRMTKEETEIWTNAIGRD